MDVEKRSYRLNEFGNKGRGLPKARQFPKGRLKRSGHAIIAETHVITMLLAVASCTSTSCSKQKLVITKLAAMRSRTRYATTGRRTSRRWTTRQPTTRRRDNLTQRQLDSVTTCHVDNPTPRPL